MENIDLHIGNAHHDLLLVQITSAEPLVQLVRLLLIRLELIQLLEFLL